MTPEMETPIRQSAPLRWLAHLPLAALPFLAAAVIEGPELGRAVAARVEARLQAAGQGWARVAVNGRDVEIRGVAPGAAALAAARAAAEGTFGVRRVVAHVLVQGG